MSDQIGPAAAAEIALGVDHMQAGRPAEAAAAFRRALARDPQHLGALINLGVALMDLKQADEAEASYRRALAVRPGEPTALRNLAVLLNSQERYDEALALADTADHGEGLIARGNALTGLGQAEAAAAVFARAADAPDVAFDARVKQGVALGVLGDFAGASAAFDAALALRPEAAEPVFQRGMLRLQQHDFAAGWADYEARWGAERFVAGSRGIVPEGVIPNLALRPSPADFAGQRVLLMAEQGIGDEVMFASMIPDLAAGAAKVTCVCDPRLVGLFSASFPGVEVTSPARADVAVAEVDRFVAMGSLGHAYRRERADFPGLPYLRPGEAALARWAGRLGPASGLRVGLSWRGGLPTSRRQARSLALEELAPILDVPACDFVSLQWGDVAAELAAFNAGRSNPIRSFPAEEIDDFEDLAALAANLDVVVSVQTALVHLCGAIGQECLALITPLPGWRYMAEDAAVVWYRSVRLFRQAQAGDWGPPLQAVAADLAARAA